MPPALPDALEDFAAQCGLRLDATPIVTAPRDVLTPLADAEQSYLVSVTGRSEGSVELVYVMPLQPAAKPCMRDVLWWLAADAWTIERSGHSLVEWAATFGIAADGEATERAFAPYREQSRALSRLLGETAYQRLLAIYASEIAQA